MPECVSTLDYSPSPTAGWQEAVDAIPQHGRIEAVNSAANDSTANPSSFTVAYPVLIPEKYQGVLIHGKMTDPANDNRGRFLYEGVRNSAMIDKVAGSRSIVIDGLGVKNVQGVAGGQHFFTTKDPGGGGARGSQFRSIWLRDFAIGWSIHQGSDPNGMVGDMFLWDGCLFHGNTMIFDGAKQGVAKSVVRCQIAHQMFGFWLVEGYTTFDANQFASQPGAGACFYVDSRYGQLNINNTYAELRYGSFFVGLGDRDRPVDFRGGRYFAQNGPRHIFNAPGWKNLRSWGETFERTTDGSWLFNLHPAAKIINPTFLCSHVAEPPPAEVLPNVVYT